MKTFAFILVIAATSGAFGADTNVDNILPPMPPSPVEEFRQWLKMPKAERMTAMAKRPPEKRSVLAQKLDEYEQLPEAVRNRRLNAVEMQWYLQTLMKTPRDQRAQSLKVIPVSWKPAIEERLRKWDQASPELREEILNNRTNLVYVSRPTPPLPNLPPTPVVQEIRTIFRAAPDRLEKAFSNFEPGERAEMLNTLQAFRNLPEAQRQECVQAFSKFAVMSKAERDAFLENVNRWQAMPAQDRKTWSEIVQAFEPMPPMPQGMGEPPFPRLEP